jgi:hypothetical protein
LKIRYNHILKNCYIFNTEITTGIFQCCWRSEKKIFEENKISEISYRVLLTVLTNILVYGSFIFLRIGMLSENLDSTPCLLEPECN